METEPDEAESESDRRALNIFLAVFFVALVGIGIWLADALVTARNADNCLSSGRRNCAPIEVPPR